jgi:16S rRNA (cytosine1402-N4)-methyltransferase
MNHPVNHSNPPTHKPVMLNEVLQFARSLGPRTILDATFGRGGHTRALMTEFPLSKITALDQDLAAIEFANIQFASEIAEGRFQIHHFNFHDARNLPAPPPEGFDLILLDLGVRSPQLDEAQRGFSFYQDGPLDMRMNQTKDLTAADVINTWPEVELLELFQKYGEIPRPQRVVRALAQDRKTEPFKTTLQLAGLIERVEGWHKKGHHPATRYFLALRMAVNRELSGLEAGIPDLMKLLRPKGQMIVITFHSLEDRIIKYAFKEATELGFPLTKKVVIPEPAELEENPRARSAKLRVFQRGSVDESGALA